MTPAASVALQVLVWAAVVAVLAAVTYVLRKDFSDGRQVGDPDDAQPDDHRSARPAAGGFTASHRTDLLVQAGAQDDSTDLGTQPVGGGTLNDVTNLGDPYTESEARLNRIFHRLDTKIREIIMSAADDAVRGVTEQLTKAKGEIDAEVAKLQDAGVSAESLAGLKAVSQSLDDRNPDAPSGGGEESPGDVGGGDTPAENPDGATDSSE